MSNEQKLRAVKTAESKTFIVSILMAGDIDTAKRVCREFCFRRPLCVAVYHGDYIYTGGEQTGFVVTLIQYARFPAPESDIRYAAEQLAVELQLACCQQSYTIIDDNSSTYYEAGGKQ